MHALDLSRDAKRQRVAAADRTEAKEIKIAAGEVGPGKTAKISFILLRFLPPIVVNAIEVHNFRLQALGFQHGGKAEDADGGKLAHDASCIHFAHGLVIELVGRGRTDEANFHGCHLLGWTGRVLRHHKLSYSRRLIHRDQLAGRNFAAHVGDQRILEHSAQLFNLLFRQPQVRKLPYSLRQLVGYVSCQGSGPFSFCDNTFGFSGPSPPGASDRGYSAYYKRGPHHCSTINLAARTAFRFIIGLWHSSNSSTPDLGGKKSLISQLSVVNLDEGWGTRLTWKAVFRLRVLNCRKGSSPSL